MKYTTAVIVLTLSLFSCAKKEEARPRFSEADYLFTFTGLWTSPQFTVPAGVHFTTFTGAVHNGKASLWMEEALASAGLEAVAETGGQGPLLAEVDSLLARKEAIGAVNIPAPPPAGNSSRPLHCNSDFSRISFASMIAPSPDWFIGVSNLDLYRNNTWLTDTVIHLRVYDAGTEDGDVFGYDNPATIPQQPVKLLTPAKAMVLANGNPSLAPIAQVRITKL